MILGKNKIDSISPAIPSHIEYQIGKTLDRIALDEKSSIISGLVKSKYNNGVVKISASIISRIKKLTIKFLRLIIPLSPKNLLFSLKYTSVILFSL